VEHRFDHAPFRVKPNTNVKLKRFATTPPSPSADKKAAGKKMLAEDVAQLAAAQEKLWATASYSVLIIFQARDAAGKDSTIKHVATGVNPQGCEVTSFGPPSAEELRHHFLWRPTLHLPGHGRIGIFNRSYYEEVLVVRVHPELLAAQRLQTSTYDDKFWQSRYDDINAFEHSLTRGGVCIIKFMLNVSKQVQKERFLERLDNPEKHWKFSIGDLRERRCWDDYTHAFESMLSATSTAWAPWYVIPADKKWFMQALVADIITSRIDELNLQMPKLSEDQRQKLNVARAELVAEKE
jgi:PPK2 family polyphosphate:nucleotide phosphotransferase